MGERRVEDKGEWNPGVLYAELPTRSPLQGPALLAEAGSEPDRVKATASPRDRYLGYSPRFQLASRLAGRGHHDLNLASFDFDAEVPMAPSPYWREIGQHIDPVANFVAYHISPLLGLPLLILRDPFNPAAWRGDGTIVHPIAPYVDPSDPYDRVIYPPPLFIGIGISGTF